MKFRLDAWSGKHARALSSSSVDGEHFQQAEYSVTEGSILFDHPIYCPLAKLDGFFT